MTAIDSATRKARLEAMAKDGTAGVQAFDAAQQAAQGYRQQAISETLAPFTFAGDPTNVTDPITALVNRRTAPAMNDVQLGGELAEEQVGYDAAGREGYLRQGRESIADMLADWERRKSLTLREEEIRKQAQQLRSSGGGSGSGSSGFANSGMTKEELVARLAGAGSVAQDQTLQALTDEAQSKGGEAEALDHIRSRVARAAGVADKQAAKAESVARAAEAGAGERGSENSRRRRRDAQIGSKAAGALGYASKGADTEVEARQQAIQRVLADLEQQYQVAQLDTDRFSRQAAEAAGLDPLLARGLFPSDPADLMSRAEATSQFGDYLEYGDKEGAAGLLGDQVEWLRNQESAELYSRADEYGISRNKAAQIAGQFMLDPSDSEAFGRQLQTLQDIQSEVAKRIGEGQTMDEVLLELMADPDWMLTPEELNYIKGEFGAVANEIGQGGLG